MNKAQLHIVNPSGATTYNQLHSAPASWAEMTREHLLIWAASFGTGLKVSLAKQVLAALLYQIPVKLYKYIPERESERLAASLKFLFAKNMLSAWLIPSIWQGIFKYHGPKSGLVNATINEFTLCERCYEQFQNTEDPEYLYTLAAILYRPCRFWGIDDDIRAKLTNHGYITRAKRFKKMPIRVIYAVYLNYEGCRHFLHAKYKDAFTPSKSKKIAKVITETPWAKIIESGANDIFGTYQMTKESNLHNFLSRLGTRIQENKKLEEDLKNARK